jgi:hypothetical protein
VFKYRVHALYVTLQKVTDCALTAYKTRKRMIGILWRASLHKNCDMRSLQTSPQLLLLFTTHKHVQELSNCISTMLQL